MRALPVVLATVLLLVASVSAQRRAVGAPAPVLAGADVSGQPFDLAAMRGSVVLLVFFGSWEARSPEAVAGVEGLAARLASRGVSAAGVAEDGDPARTLELVRSRGFSLPVLRDPRHLAAGDFAVEGLPSVIVVDRAGVVRAAERWRDTSTLTNIERVVLSLP